MKIHTRRDNRRKPHVFEYYNVEIMTPPKLSATKSYLAHIHNELVKYMNGKKEDNYYLPKYLVMIVDRDIITDANVFDYGMTETLTDALKWLLININYVIETRKEDLYGKCPGAVTQSKEPRIIWVTMLKRPDYSYDRKINALATKFNSILEDVISGDTRSHILHIHVTHISANFDRLGKLTTNGEYEYWRNFDCQMRDFDKGKTELEPRRFTLHPTTHHRESKNTH